MTPGHRHAAVLLLSACLAGCGEERPAFHRPAMDMDGGGTALSDGGGGGADASADGDTGGGAEASADGGSGGGADASADGGSASTGGEGGAAAFGSVDLVAYYEEDSDWTDNTAAQAMVEAMFSQFEALLTTSGPWDATLEVYLTDDVDSSAKTYFDVPPQRVQYEGRSVLVPSTWTEVVRGAADKNGPADTSGAGFDIGIDFNISAHADNPGLLRHELMHGLGVVTVLDPPIMSESDELSNLMPGDTTSASLYDTFLVDAAGDPLLGDYDASTKRFTVQPYAIQSTYDEWLDAETGVAFRGVGDDGSPYDMLVLVFADPSGARQDLNEPRDVMSASFRAMTDDWDVLSEADRALLRQLGYRLRE